MKGVSLALAILLPLLPVPGFTDGLASGVRLVTADGALTEIVYALGAQEHLVGVDSTSRFPAATSELPSVGYIRALPFEGILALQPDLLLTSDEAAPPVTLDRLRDAGVEVVSLPVAWSGEGLLERIHGVGQILGLEAQAASLAADIESGIRQASASAELSTPEPPRVLFLLSAGTHGLMIAGEETPADALMSMLGARNAATGTTGFKPANREALLAARPDAVIVAETRPGQFRIRDWRELGMLPAWQQGHYLVADSMLLLGFGPRLPDAMAAVARVLEGASGTRGMSDVSVGVSHRDR